MCAHKPLSHVLISNFISFPGVKAIAGACWNMVMVSAFTRVYCVPKAAAVFRAKSLTGAPDIDLGLLQAESDLNRLVLGIKLARKILAEEPMVGLGLTELLPGNAAQSDDALRNAIRAHARTVYHPVGTCAMGTGTCAVVNSKLKVHGLEGLRVVDASIMPTIVSGNTNGPAMMIAEKAADLILADNLDAR